MGVPVGCSPLQNILSVTTPHYILCHDDLPHFNSQLILSILAHGILQPMSMLSSFNQGMLANIDVADSKLSEMTRLDLGQGLQIDLSGRSYVDDFLMPNFYFHMTTAYDILRMAGAPIGKRDFMMHLVPFLNP
jgi:hypothetical protein